LEFWSSSLEELVNLFSKTFSIDLYRDKRILVTGHTGFKGYWLSRFLVLLGAEVHGLALSPLKNSLFFREPSLGLKSNKILDVRDYKALNKYFSEFTFDGIFHLAAQPLVLESYRFPRETFEVNTQGTANLLEAIFGSENNSWIVAVTTDKVYRNEERAEGYREDEPLGGKDPYSASKAAMEMVINAWQTIAKLDARNMPIIAARAGNVIGGGDVSKDRLLPDLIRSVVSEKPAIIRNPDAIRPWQHVLDPLSGYMMIGEQLMRGKELSTSFNFGPTESSKISVREVAEIASDNWPLAIRYVIETSPNQMPESQLLWLNSDRARAELGWENKLSAKEAIAWTIEWELNTQNGRLLQSTDKQIQRFLEL
jgi:CDP-glucose 4,6-dehydratase